MPQGLPRGTRITITSGLHAGKTGTVEANAFQRTVDYPEEYAEGFHVVLDDGRVVTVRKAQVEITAVA